MKKTLQMMLTSTKSNDAPVIFLWKSVHVLFYWTLMMILLRHYCPDDVIKLLYSLYAFIALSFDILHLWHQYMCEKWILTHIWYAFGFAPKPAVTPYNKTKCPIFLSHSPKRILSQGILIQRCEREMCPWAISKYFSDWVQTQVLKCENMPMDEQSANHK
jgi:hypothetical protein